MYENNLYRGNTGIERDMRRRSVFFTGLALFLGVFGFLSLKAESSTDHEIGQIDAQIAELQDKKRGFEGRALRHENYAEYLQFDQKAVLETRRHLQLADENWAKAARVQFEIDKLQARRQKLAGKNPGKPKEILGQESALTDADQEEAPNRGSFFIEGDLP
jgi:hypothetical protein